MFLHVDLDAFFSSVEQLDNPEYRGKPVIVGGLPTDTRSVVSTCSYEARKFGVHSAMPIVQAYRLCPHGIFLRGRMKRYLDKSADRKSVV
jgi:DNA polymerase-4